MGLPPSEAGVVHSTVAWALPAVADGVRGAVGGPSGVTWFEVPAGPLPTELRATTVKVYGVPLVRPVTLHESTDGTTTV